MSFIRYSEDNEWFGQGGGYIYLQEDHNGFNPSGMKFNTKIRGPVIFAELAMRMLDQSNVELTDEELKTCQKAFAERLHIEEHMVDSDD